MASLIASLVLVLANVAGLAYSVHSVTSSVTKYVSSVSSVALVGYAMIFLALIFFSVVLPALDAAKGKRRHIHLTTFFSFLILFFGIFMLDTGFRSVIGKKDKSVSSTTFSKRFKMFLKKPTPNSK